MDTKSQENQLSHPQIEDDDDYEELENSSRVDSNAIVNASKGNDSFNISIETSSGDTNFKKQDSPTEKFEYLSKENKLDAAFFSKTKPTISSAQRRKFWTVIFCIVALFGLIGAFGGDFLDALFNWLDGVNRDNPWNVVLSFGLVLFMVTPFGPFYTLSILCVSFVYGWWALPIAYSASTIGAWIVFKISRSFCKHYDITYEKLISFPYFWNQRKLLLAVERSIDRSGFKVCTILQLSFFPYGMLNVILSTTELTFVEFVRATIISRLKLVNIVWLGIGLEEVAELRNHSISEWKTQDIISIVISASCSLLSIISISIYTRNYLKRMEEEMFLKESETELTESSER